MRGGPLSRSLSGVAEFLGELREKIFSQPNFSNSSKGRPRFESVVTELGRDYTGGKSPGVGVLCPYEVLGINLPFTFAFAPGLVVSSFTLIYGRASP